MKHTSTNIGKPKDEKVGFGQARCCLRGHRQVLLIQDMPLLHWAPYLFSILIPTSGAPAAPLTKQQLAVLDGVAGHEAGAHPYGCDGAEDLAGHLRGRVHVGEARLAAGPRDAAVHRVPPKAAARERQRRGRHAGPRVQVNQGPGDGRPGIGVAHVAQHVAGLQLQGRIFGNFHPPRPAQQRGSPAPAAAAGLKAAMGHLCLQHQPLCPKLRCRLKSNLNPLKVLYFQAKHPCKTTACSPETNSGPLTLEGGRAFGQGWGVQKRRRNKNLWSSLEG